MTDFYLVLELVGLIALSAVVLYFLVWKEPVRRAGRRSPRAEKPMGRARARR